MVLWRDIPGLFPYQASEEGKIRNTSSGTVRRLQLDRYGYLRVELKGKRWKVHRLVYLAFHGEIPKGFVVHHRNARRADNRPSNLEAVPPSENTRLGLDHSEILRRVEREVLFLRDEVKTIAVSIQTLQEATKASNPILTT